MKFYINKQKETAAKPPQTDVTAEYPAELKELRKLSRVTPKSQRVYTVVDGSRPDGLPVLVFEFTLGSSGLAHIPFRNLKAIMELRPDGRRNGAIVTVNFEGTNRLYFRFD